MQDLQKLLTYLRPHWMKFILATIAMLAVGLLQSAIGALIVPVFNQAFALSGSGQQTETLFKLQELIPGSGPEAWRVIAMLLILFTAAKGVAEYFSTYLMAFIGQAAVLRLRQDLYNHMLSQSADFFEKHRTNYLVSRLVSSAASIELAVAHTLRDMLREGFTLIIFLAASFYYSWRLTLSALIIGPVIAFLTARFGRSLRHLAHEALVGNQQLIDTAQETLSNQNIVKAYLAEPREHKRFSRVAQSIMRANLRASKITGIAPPTIEMIGVIAVAVLLFIGQREIVTGRMDAAQFLAFLFFLFSSYDPMRKLSRLHHNMEPGLAAVRHVFEILEESRHLPEVSNAIQLRPLKESIELRKVFFNYQSEDRTILSGIDLTIPAGSMVALVGESGGGKSTVTKLILRLYDPVSGAVLWDGTDLREASIKSLRKHIALVTQETVLFNDTVRYNISYGRPDATDQEIEDAARIAYAHDFIKELPNGYGTIIGERGVFLSGGQRQRLAIARAILADAPVLILDEATSALDTESEQLIQQALSNLIKNRTTIVIAHRLSTIRRADQIVVIERGKIIETGTHHTLLANNGQYRKLYELQFANEEEEILR
jgi:ATP-binding cassette, subfamily B, bacterial MsbA